MYSLSQNNIKEIHSKFKKCAKFEWNMHPYWLSTITQPGCYVIIIIILWGILFTAAIGLLWAPTNAVSHALELLS